MKLTEIDLVWDSVIGAKGYKLYRADLLIYSGSNTSFNDTGLQTGSQYTYQVSSINASGESPESIPLVAYTLTPPPVLPPPITPTGLHGTVLSQTEIYLQWNVTAGEMIYKLYRDGVLVYSPDTNSQLDTDLSPSTAYTYTISARNTSGESAQSSPPLVVSSSAIPVTDPPENLTPYVISAVQIDLSWDAVVGTHILYKLYNNTSIDPIYSGYDISYSNVGLTPYTQYSYTVVAHNSSGDSVHSSASLATTQYISAPTFSSVYAEAYNSVSLSWSQPLGAVSYKLYCNGSVTPIYSGTTPSFVHTPLISKTQYTYQVKVLDINGLASNLSAASSVTTPPKPPTPPTLTATVASYTQINLSWTPITDAISYNLYLHGSNSPVAVSAPTTTYNDTGLNYNTLYSYQVKSVNSDLQQQSAFSNTATATTQNLPIPATPQGLSATGASISEIDLTWNSVTFASCYNLYRDNLPTPVYRTTNTFQHDTGLSNNTRYCYKISAFDASGESPLSSPAVYGFTLGIPAPTLYPASVISISRIDLSWTSVTNADCYNLYRNGTFVHSIASPTTTQQDTGLASGTLYSYTASAVNYTAGESGKSNSVSATTLYDKPAVPVISSITSVSSTRIDFSWGAVALAASYGIYRDGTRITDVSSNVTSYQDTGLAVDSAHTYTVTALNNNGRPNGESNQSVGASSRTRLNAPINLSAIAKTTTEIDLTWTAVTSAITPITYSLYRVTGTSQPENPVLIATTTSPSLNNTSGLVQNTFYKYYVTAKNIYGESVYSTAASTITFGDHALLFGAIGGPVPNSLPNYIVAPTLGNFNQITVEAWVKSAPASTFQTVITSGVPYQNNYWKLSLDYDQAIYCQEYQTTYFVVSPVSYFDFGQAYAGNAYVGGQVVGTTNVQDGAWHHIAGQYDGTNLTFWTDGRKEATQTIALNVQNNSNTYIGATYWPNNNTYDYGYNESIDEIRVSNIKRYTSNFTPSTNLGTDGNTVGYWKFDQGYGNLAIDSSNNNKTGTLYGATLPAWVPGVTYNPSSAHVYTRSAWVGYNTATTTSTETIPDTPPYTITAMVVAETYGPYANNNDGKIYLTLSPGNYCIVFNVSDTRYINVSGVNNYEMFSNLNSDVGTYYYTVYQYL